MGVTGIRAPAPPPRYDRTMTDAHALEPGATAAIAAAVQAAYARAVAEGWPPEARSALWAATVEAVREYLAHAPDDPNARRYHHLLVDLAADVTAEAIAAWPPAVMRAARLAATHTLRAPSKPHHRPRAQALLKRLDLVQNPVLQARERLLLAVARRRQAMGDERGSGPLAGRRADVAIDLGLMVLARITEVVRAMPLPDAGDDAAVTALSRLRELQGLVEGGQVLDAARHPAVFEALQRLAAPDRPDLPIGAALDALEAVRLQANPAVRPGRLALAEMVFELELGAYGPDDRVGLARHLSDLAHVARNLGEIPAAQLGPILFRLRQRLADPASEAIEARIEEALAVLGRLGARREAGRARLARAEALGAGEETRPDVAAAHTRLREIDTLIDAVHQVSLARLAPAEAMALGRVYAQLEDLAGDHGLDAEAFGHALGDIVLQLDRPALAVDRVWLAGRAALRQVVALRRSIDEQLRGLGLDRHLDPAARQARQADLERRAAALDRTRIVLGSLPLARIHPAAAESTVAALGGLVQAMRLAAAGGDARPLRTALDLLATIGGRLS